MKSFRDHALELLKKGVVKPTRREMLAQGDEIHNHIAGFTGKQMIGALTFSFCLGATAMLWINAPSLRTARIVNEVGQMTDFELMGRLALPADVGSAIAKILQLEPPAKRPVDDWLYLLGRPKAPSLSLSRTEFLRQFVEAFTLTGARSDVLDDILNASVLVAQPATAAIIKSLQSIPPVERAQLSQSLTQIAEGDELLLKMAQAISIGSNHSLIALARRILIHKSPLSAKIDDALNFIWAHRNENIKCSF